MIESAANMKAKFHRGLLYFVPHVQFECKYPVKESVDRLAKASKSVYAANFRFENFDPILTGHVWKDDVALHRKVPAFHWTGRPYFIGKFITKDDEIILEGCFRMSVLEGVGYIIGNVMTAVIVFAILLALLFGEWDVIINKWIVLGIIVVITSSIYLLNRISRNWVKRDIEWISDRIQRALGN
jgi:hypothetical protein